MLELRTDVRSLFLVGAHRVGRFAAIGAWLQNRWTCSSAACHCDELPMNFRQIEAFRHVMLHGSITFLIWRIGSVSRCSSAVPGNL
jgi:hypothetical protein